MVRKKVMGTKKESRDLIRWRGHEVTRIEAFSDAVFAFAVTLLVISLEVPKNIDELLNSLYGFFPFAVSFTMLFQIWAVQNKFFRRYGLHDETTVILNAILMFLVLYFVYPLKFLFSLMLGSGFTSSPGKLSYLFYIYGSGFASIYFLFAIMYYHASKKKDLQLTESELFETRTYIYRNVLVAMVAVLSIGVAYVAKGTQYIGIAGVVYALIGIVISMTHGRRGKIHRRKFGEDVIAQTVPDDELHGH